MVEGEGRILVSLPLGSKGLEGPESIPGDPLPRLSGRTISTLLGRGRSVLDDAFFERGAGSAGGGGVRVTTIS